MKLKKDNTPKTNTIAMSINRNRQKLNNARCNSDYRKILLNYLYPLYWNDGIVYKHSKNKEAWSKSKTKQIINTKSRLYKTWKHNRSNQWIK